MNKMSIRLKRYFNAIRHWAKKYSSVFLLISLLANIALVIYSREANEQTRKADQRATEADNRAKMLFRSKIRPLIEDRPIDFHFFPELGHLGAGETVLEAFNYSGFTAYDIKFDVRYFPNDWIQEWEKAKKQDALIRSSRGEKLSEEDKELISWEPTIVPILKANDVIKIDKNWRGAIPVPNFCKKNKQFDVLIRTTWKNENNHTFERIKKYSLMCTTEGEGRSFTFVPEEIHIFEE